MRLKSDSFLQQCSRCGTPKPATEFYETRAGGQSSYCKPCTRAYIKQWKQANPRKVWVSSKRKDLKSKYGITLDEWAAMVLESGGRCAICKDEQPLVVDHDHATGKIRGMLCQTCNLVLGQFGDDQPRILAALTYLEAHSRAPRGS
jgi:hypothetical protein